MLASALAWLHAFYPVSDSTVGVSRDEHTAWRVALGRPPFFIFVGLFLVPFLLVLVRVDCGEEGQFGVGFLEFPFRLFGLPRGGSGERLLPCGGLGVGE